MDNRDLLINAARAGDIVGKYYVAYGERDVNEGIDIGGGRLWNPITRNEDAFTLMVKCQIDIKVHEYQIFADSLINGDKFSSSSCIPGWVSNETPTFSDREKATRLAIVNCAAIIGDNL